MTIVINSVLSILFLIFIFIFIKNRKTGDFYDLKRILFVSSQPPNFQLTEANRVDIVWAQNGEKALELLLKWNIDLIILTDEELRDMSPFSLLAHIKSQHYYHSLKVLMLCTDAENEKRAYSIGADEALYSHHTPNNFWSIIQKYLL